MKILATQARKIVFMTIAVICLIVGLVTAPTPLPTGVPLIAVGTVMLISVSATARRLLKKARLRSRRLDNGIAFVETRTHRKMSTMLKRTRPLARKIEAKAALGAAAAALRNARTRGGSEEKG